MVNPEPLGLKAVVMVKCFPKSMLWLLIVMGFAGNLWAGAQAMKMKWAEKSENVYFLGMYRDYRGNAASLYARQAGTGSHAWLAVHHLALKKDWNQPAPHVGEAGLLTSVIPGTPGIFKFFTMEQEGNNAPESNSLTAAGHTGNEPDLVTFISFIPSGNAVALDSAVAWLTQPYALGLLTAQTGAREAAYGKLGLNSDPVQRLHGAGGMVTGGMFDLAGKFLKEFPVPRTANLADEPDFNLIIPWLRTGLGAVAGKSPAPGDEAASPEIFLLPSIQVWLQEKSREKTTQAYYDTLFEKHTAKPILTAEVPATPFREEYPPLEQGAFETGNYAYESVLNHVDPDYFQIVKEANQHLRVVSAGPITVSILEQRQEGKKKLLVFVNPDGNIEEALYSPKLQTVFGTQAAVLIWVENQFDLETPGEVIRYRELPANPAKTIEALKKSVHPKALGYLARAAHERRGDMTWDAWTSFIRQQSAVNPGFISGLSCRGIFRVQATTDTADALQTLLPEILKSRPYPEAGREAFNLAAVYIYRHELAKARAVLKALPEQLRTNGGSYDGKDDLGWENRCGLEMFAILLDFFDNQRVHPASPELRKYAAAALENFDRITADIPKADRWKTLLVKAGVQARAKKRK